MIPAILLEISVQNKLNKALILTREKNLLGILKKKEHGRVKMNQACGMSARCLCAILKASTYLQLGSQVAAALRQQGLESSNLILGIDFTKSNEWTGR